MKLEKLFVKTKVSKLFFISIIPGTIGMVASGLYMVIDGIFIGKLLGDVAFAVVTIAISFVAKN